MIALSKGDVNTGFVRFCAQLFKFKAKQKSAPAGYRGGDAERPKEETNKLSIYSGRFEVYAAHADEGAFRIVSRARLQPSRLRRRKASVQCLQRAKIRSASASSLS